MQSSLKQSGTESSRKQVSFSGDAAAQQTESEEIKKLHEKIADMVMQNSELTKKLDKKNYEDVYRENKRLQLELKNMYII